MSYNMAMLQWYNFWYTKIFNSIQKYPVLAPYIKLYI